MLPRSPWGALMRLGLCVILFHALFASAVDKKFVKRTAFDNQLSPFLFFDDSEVVLVTDPIAGILYRTDDAGASWEEVEDVTEGEAIQVFMNPSDNKVAVVLGRRKKHWITQDQGKTWRDFVTDEHPAKGLPVSFHSGDSDSIILNTGRGLTLQATYTTDGFKSHPKTLRDNSLQCMWAKERPQFQTGSRDADNRVICLVLGKRSGKQDDQRLVVSDNYFKDDKEPPIENGRTLSGFVSMVSATKYILAARKAEGTNEMAMYTTVDGVEWHRAFFGGQKIEAGSYTVMEGTNYSVRVDAVTGAAYNRMSPMGVLYSSNSNGTYFTSNEKFTNRNEFGYVDFEKILNIEGVALTNVVANHEAVLDEDAPKILHSMITFDDGRTFQSLKAGKDDLHLHSYTEMRNYGKVFSAKGAPGLVMGVGNTGDKLLDYNDGDVFVSDNGGENWYHSKMGAHKYEFGDSGLLVIVYDEEPTDQVIYSMNHGKNEDGWKVMKIMDEGEDMLRPVILTTVPDSTSQKMLMSGATGRSDKIKHWVYAMDFGVLDLRKCKAGDLEVWHARENEDGEPGCIMGHTQSFHRRKADADCFIDKEFEEPAPETESCGCTDQDFECDYNFMRDGDGCKPVNNVLQHHRDECKSHDDTFMGPSGFRKIPGNDCKENNASKKKLADIERSCDQAGRGGSAPADGTIEAKIKVWDAPGFKEYRYLERASTSKDDDETIVAITEYREAWITRDHGKKWDVIEAVEDEVVAIYPNLNQHDDLYFITPSKTVFYTEDRGETFSQFEAPGAPNTAGYPVLRFHATNPGWMIYTTCENLMGECNPVAHVSKRKGRHWEEMMDHAGNCEFIFRKDQGRSENLVYCAKSHGNDKRELLSSEDFFETSKPLFDSIVNYATMAEFIIVATRDVEDESSLRVNSSVDGTIFAAANFPPKLQVTHHAGYTVLDSSTNAIFLHATVNSRPDQEYGTIIKSNSNGTNFVTSLPLVNRNTLGFVDFEKLLGVEGAALANVVMNVEDVEKGKAKKTKTMITHNDGADWVYIPAPDMDNEGKKYPCAGKTRANECSLHLHGYTERRKPDDGYSSPSAVGLLMGIGNVGEALGEYRDGDTFVSRDGGITWKTAQKGQYMWEFGDQGSIILLAQDRIPTTSVLYSVDEGEHWQAYEFSEEEIEITDVTSTPSDGSLNFMLWGRQTSSRRHAVTVNIDFTGMFPRGLCNLDQENPDSEDSDYELWTPKHPTQDSDCLFGHEAEFYRKKLTSTDCFNGPKVERFRKIARNCACTVRDFECDYNYERNPNDGTCHLVGEKPDAQRVCRENANAIEYYDVTGYRRIPLDTCTGGKDLELQSGPKPCPNHEDEFNQRHGTSGAVIFFAVIIPIVVAFVIGYWAYKRYAGQFGRIRLGGSDSAVGGVTSTLRSPSFDTNSPFLRYPVMGVSALVAGVMAIPMIVWSAVRWGRERFGRGGRGGYSSMPRAYTSRRSFARGSGDYAAVGAADESDLLGEDSDDEGV